ncbi:MAG: hypothetical protein LBJ64_04450 [Deltaproteobacteria bacterium]|jgi:hypothetical protein|nr:hypothetical protein [Deltaproteobacteria bacterium]
MTAMRKISAILAAIFLLLLVFRAPAQAQDGSWRPLSTDMVKAELESRLARNPSYATIWNAGYDIYRLHYRNQDTARVIHLGYMSVRGQTPEENRAIRQAAIYWQKVHDYGITNVPVGIDENLRGQIYYGSDSYLTTLAMRRPKGGPVPLRQGDRAPRGKRRAKPYRGRPDNPYPGPYYSGQYPP